MTLDHTTNTRRRPIRGLFRRFLARRDGATAIEFTLLCLPFFAIVFASLETFVAFSAEQVLASANDTMARKIRTGEITFNLGKTSDMSQEQFRKAFCDEIAILMPCSPTELKTPNKLFIDVRSFPKFTDIPKSIPLTGKSLDTSAFKFSPGGKKSINIIRAYYRWDIVTDLVRPYISNVKSADGSQQNYLMVATTVVQNEDYP
ncbi:pilus assembly protein [Shinella curvata]|uniref:Pilus assembly protein n=1 Tax=Shinella curvata TaxID=1817964 RepID=A0ABT8XCQ3_9HYPH|nr:TadE/TadG family type IV pilus assembly protein [Shinella curvata]MCJ8054491.1 pilus assembly protein [Shinella curvata]MDO6121512.1 pilus assembly protein [Shinella curvata]